MSRSHRWLAAVTLGAGAGAPLAAQAPPLRATQQIAAAVLAAPPELRASATVLGYGGDGQLRTLRSGSGGLICLAPNPAHKAFQVACYHRSMEPFMARGRALRAAGLGDDQVDSTRFAEVRAGKLEMPTHAAALYNMFGPEGTFDPATGQVTGAKTLFVVYIPGATPESTGIPETPAENAPWIMAAGTPRAHIMFVPSMR